MKKKIGFVDLFIDEWHANNYPAWIKGVADAVHAVKKDALVIFNTYNWGWTDAELRREFLQKMPKDVVIQVTFEMFKKIKRGKYTAAVMDYTISESEPGEYFTSECAMAKEYGIPPKKYRNANKR